MKPLSDNQLREFLEEKTNQYNSPAFIESDPVQVPHQFTVKEDIEIAAFLTATIAWGSRVSIIRSAQLLMSLMDNSPHRFVLDSEESDMKRFRHYVHRTFQPVDSIYFMKSLKNIYRNHGSTGEIFQTSYARYGNLEKAMKEFRKVFFEVQHSVRSQKHVADIERNSSAKRLNLFLRWMVRKDKAGVDFGLWNKIPMSDLFLPLDVHTAHISRKLGLLHRKQNDWKAVLEITGRLREMDPLDPVKYDYALFGLGIFERF